MTTFRLPDLGEGLQEAEIVAWHVSVGDRVVADQPLVSVETDKAVVEVPVPWSGTVTALECGPGDVVQIGAPLAQIETAKPDTADAGSVVGSLPTSREATRAEPPAAPRVPAPGGAGPRPKAAPAVRALAQALSVDLAAVSGTGQDGLITMADVEAAARRDQRAPRVTGGEPLRGVRRAMSDAMARSGADVVPATVIDEADISAWASGRDATVRLARAIARACATEPALNAAYNHQGRVRTLNNSVDLGIAMQTEDGLFAPVLRDVGNRSNEDLRRGLEAMKRDVAARSVPHSELRGQTITLSNFGMLGGLHAALVIVTPQVAIVGAGRIHDTARVRGGSVDVARVLPLSLTFDHRVVTGAEAIAFLNALIGDLEAGE